MLYQTGVNRLLYNNGCRFSRHPLLTEKETLQSVPFPIRLQLVILLIILRIAVLGTVLCAVLAAVVVFILLLLVLIILTVLVVLVKIVFRHLPYLLIDLMLQK